MEDNNLQLKILYKNLVRSIKYYRSIDQEKDFTNEQISEVLEYDPAYFRSLVGKGGTVTEKHLKKLREAFMDIPNLTESEKKEKSGSNLPDNVLLVLNQELGKVGLSLNKLGTDQLRSQQHNHSRRTLPADAPVESFGQDKPGVLKKQGGKRQKKDN